jgi:acetylglutamate kinase
MDKLYIIKIGGNVIDEDEALADFLKQFSTLSGRKILVHGGGKLATRLADQIQVPQTMIEGRRVTDFETLRIITMVYAGLVNKTIVSALQSHHCNAVGLTGADGNSVLAHKREHPITDYGFVGDIDTVDHSFLSHLLEQGLVPVFAPITHNGKGQLLNTNADTMAQEIARALSKTYQTILVFTFEKAGVLTDVKDENSVIAVITRSEYQKLKSGDKIFAGMIPKLDNAFRAIDEGVNRVIIGKAADLVELINGNAGTTITHA